MPGPHLDLTAPYIEGPGSFAGQLHQLTGPEDARRLVDYWADEGMTSFKAYMNLTRAELRTAIDRAHKRGLRLTGHLCSVTWPEAIDAGIDGFEHGPVFTDTEFAPDKKPDLCPPSGGRKSWANIEVSGREVTALIRRLVERRVAVTSTLAIFETFMLGRPPLQSRVLEAMAPHSPRRPPFPSRLSARRWPSSWRSRGREDCSSPGRTRPGVAASCRGSEISAGSSSWWRPVSNPSRRSKWPL